MSFEKELEELNTSYHTRIVKIESLVAKYKDALRNLYMKKNEIRHTLAEKYAAFTIGQLFEKNGIAFMITSILCSNDRISYSLQSVNKKTNKSNTSDCCIYCEKDLLTGEFKKIQSIDSVQKIRNVIRIKKVVPVDVTDKTHTYVIQDAHDILYKITLNKDYFYMPLQEAMTNNILELRKDIRSHAYTLYLMTDSPYNNKFTRSGVTANSIQILTKENTELLAEIVTALL